MADQFDVVVIGAGPAGYVAAIRSAQLGLKTACIDDWLDEKGQPAPGGTCLNVGCIPSKALLESSELLERSREEFSDHGLSGKVTLDLSAMLARKRRIVRGLNQGVTSLLKSNDVKMISARACLHSGRRVEVMPVDGAEHYFIDSENVILATGSRPVDLAVAPLDGEQIVDSAAALSFSEVPQRLGIIGAGVIGLELGSVWRRLGSDVVLLEAQDEFLAMADSQIANDGLRFFTEQGLDIRLGARVTSTTRDDGVIVDYQDADGTHQERFDRLIVAVGREANSDHLFASDCPLAMGRRGQVIVDDHCRTNQPGVYAIGDLVRGPMLAHKGSEEGIMVAEVIAGKQAWVDYETIPSVLYTQPEIAWVGKNEAQLKAAGTDFRVGSFPYAASGRAMAMGDTRGLVKILADVHTDRILGVHMIGNHCSELIAEAVIAMQFQGSSEDLAMTVFAHPSLSEVLHEAAMDVNGLAIHKGRSRRP